MALAQQAQETINELLKLGFTASATMDELKKERERVERWYREGDITNSFLNKKIVEFEERKNDALQALETDAQKLIDEFTDAVKDVYTINLEEDSSAYRIIEAIDTTPTELETLYSQAVETENYTKMRLVQTKAARDGLRVTCGFADYGKNLESLVNRAKEYALSIAIDETGVYRTNLASFSEMFCSQIDNAQEKARSFMVG